MLTANQNGITDNFGELEDWIEVYNPNNFAVNLSGYYFSDDPEVRNKWVVSSSFADSVTVPANGWLLFWADADVEQGVLHADFRLSNNGEYLSLAGPDGYTLADEIQWNYIAPDTSLGRISDGSNEWTLFIISTPEASNNTGVIQIAESSASPFVAYPNPTSSMLYFSSALDVRVYDLSGKLLDSFTKTRAIDTRSWPAGIYLVETPEGGRLRIMKN